MNKEYRIGFIGTDGRTFLSALETSRAKSDGNTKEYRGVVVRGNNSMRKIAQDLQYPVEFLDTEDNSVKSYAEALIRAFTGKELDCAVVMPESLAFQGLIDMVEAQGFGSKIIGLTSGASFIEADKIRCKQLCVKAGIPVAPEWEEVDTKDYRSVLELCLRYIHKYGGAVLKYPYSAAGKGARVILDTWRISDVYEKLLSDYGTDYEERFGSGQWPLLIEARMSGVEISFTALVDKEGNFAILPTALDYPERYAGPAGPDNPITGGMGAISPHPFESPELISLAGESVIKPLVEEMRTRGLLRPCVLYPGCFVSFNAKLEPVSIRVCEVNIRPGEPEFQPVARRIMNLGALIESMSEGHLDLLHPEIRNEQISMTVGLVTGPGGPQGQKGYPWSCTKGEKLEIDLNYFRKKGIIPILSAADFDIDKGIYKSDGTRVAYLCANSVIKENKAISSEILRAKLYSAFDTGKIRVVPRENISGNRLDLRRDIGLHYSQAQKIKGRDINSAGAVNVL